MTTDLKFSVITIVKGRALHLQNLLQGIEKSSLKPTEVVIVSIDEDPEISAFDKLPLNVFRINSEDGHLPIGKARNYGAKKANNDHLIFLDVDCIPSSTFFEQILTQAISSKTLIMGTPRYLTRELPRNYKADDLDKYSIHHPHRPQISGLQKTSDYMLFWSLTFYIPKNLFIKLEGFDERYTGYGAEDTDFALKLKHTPGYSFYLSEACVYHQQHPVYSPPVNKVDEIIKNAEIFYSKWNRWVMENWLKAFAEKDLINWSMDATSISKTGTVTDKLLEECYKPNAPFM
ncbi:glycosyltransferase family 2 protein [Christiangramia aquimixticola]|uniref:glycosyltransferase family 2 protein n=1 Tax=Christiangramia aquimixticola TaxID=1697558 RepID=UPI003AA8B0AE